MLEFADKRVLVVGGRFSAEDLAVMCVTAGSSDVTVSSRKGTTGAKLPDMVVQKPILELINGSKVT